MPEEQVTRTSNKNQKPAKELFDCHFHRNTDSTPSSTHRLEGLRELCSLRRLLVSGNRVGVVEGLPRGLTELHVQDQRLPPGDALILDPHALAAVQVRGGGGSAEGEEVRKIEVEW